MAEGTLYGIAAKVLKNLGSPALDEVALAWGFKDRLEKLKDTINTIKDVLLDAEDRQVDSRAIRAWLERLSTAVYAVDDLFDEVAAVASRKQLRGGKKVIKEVQTFFSRSNQIIFPFTISRKIRTIRQELDGIVKDNAEFNFVNRPLWEGNVIDNVRGRDQTISYVDSEEVIGRDCDKKVILDLLLASGETENEVLLVIPIVGIGGQGKTTLAQLLYNDPRVEEYFELRLWVCVSDVFDVKEITEKLLKSTTNTVAPKLEMEQLQGLLRNKLGDKRYLLILDDVWNENREEWLKLMALLKIGRKGSKILVTTRSREVANIMGTVPQYELQGLTEEKSWELFQKVAFKPGQHQENPQPVMEVGKEIVKKCANVPLAIRAVGSLLYGKDESKWLSVKNTSLANISGSQNNTLDILKLSYQHLPSPLKNCFAYCSLFPKDYIFNKETLVDMWMAEGFIINNEGQNMEELAEDYFRILLQRCFFQDVKKCVRGDIMGCKMHDLVHDLAIQVAGVKCQVVTNCNNNYSNKGTHHLSFSSHLTSLSTLPTWMLNLKLLRTFLLPRQIYDGSPISNSICQEFISSFRCLRVLDVHSIEVQSLPSSIGKLIHLRYLNLSNTPTKELPGSITNLQNLQTLKLYWCKRLKALPQNLRKLYNLRSLDVGECTALIHMPPGLSKLTSLRKLPEFKVNHEDYAKLSDLKTLNNLRGQLSIIIKGELKNPLLEATEANLKGKNGITDLVITMNNVPSCDNLSPRYHDEDVLEGLKPHPNLIELRLKHSMGRKLPSWAMNNLCINLPKLVEVGLWGCKWWQQVPSFRQLPFLKRLHLWGLRSVEYMDTVSCMDDLSLLSDSSSTELTFFPSLEELYLGVMDNLEGWWKGGANVNDAAQEVSHHQLTEQLLLSMSFSKLSKLSIEACPNLKILPLCPTVEELALVDVNKAISVSKMVASISASGCGSKLKKLTISNAKDLKSLPRECLHQLFEVKIQRDKNLESTDEVFTSLSSSLRALEFFHCMSMRYWGQGLEHLTALEKLVLMGCPQLELSSSEQMPWKSFKNLTYLRIDLIPKLVRLPSGLQHLVDLYHLEISWNDELKELPEWISCFRSLQYLKLCKCPKLTSLPDGIHKLTSLNHLHIFLCPQLTERCRAPNGTDWPKIQHIPFVSVREVIY